VPRDNAIVAAKAKSRPVKSPFSGWDGSIAGAREWQAKLARDDALPAARTGAPCRPAGVAQKRRDRRPAARHQW